MLTLPAKWLSRLSKTLRLPSAEGILVVEHRSFFDDFTVIPANHPLEPLILTSEFQQYYNTLITRREPLRCTRPRTSADAPTLKALFRDGPLLFCPLTFAPHDGCDPVPLGGVLVMSSPQCKLPKVDRHMLGRVAHIVSELALPLYAAQCAFENKWHRQAQGTLHNVTSTLLMKDKAGALPAGPHPYGIRGRVARRYVSAIRQGMQLDRCGILIQAGHSPGFWFLVEQQGFPPLLTFQRRYYVRHDGLTGSVLTCRPGEHLHVLDVESDATWRSHHKRMIRSPDEVGPMSYLGVPIYSGVNKDATAPYGAIVCCRFQGKASSPRSFNDHEILHVQTIAQQAAFFFDMLSWRELTQRHHSLCHSLASIWSRKWPTVELIEATLRLLATRGPFDRLLLSTLSADRHTVEGRAVYGFRPDLIEDTRRLVFTHSKADRTAEDVLSVIVRQRLTRPIIVDPHNNDDPYSVHVNTLSAGRQGLSNPIVLIPLIGRRGTPIGSILAELRSRHHAIYQQDLDEYSLFAVHLATRIEFAAERVKRDYAVSTLKSIERAMDRDACSLSFPVRTLEVCIAKLCEMYGYSCGLAYAYDVETRVLRGVASIGLDNQQVVVTIYPVDQVDPSRNGRQGLASEAYNQRTVLSLNRMDRLPVNPQDVARVGIPGHFKGTAIPLIIAGRCLGVIILAGANPLRLTKRRRHLFPRVRRFAALSLAITEGNRRARVLWRELSAMTGILHTVHRFSSVRVAEKRLQRFTAHNRATLQLMLQFIADLFHAQMVAFFTPDEALTLRADSRECSSVVTGETDPRFYLRAAIGYDDQHINSADFTYTPTTNALTSAAIRTLHPVLTPNVASDPRNSGRLNKHATDVCGGEYRTWLGVPIVAAEEDRRYLYGVLTVTRGRRHLDDELAFTEHDAIAAERLADLIALGFHHEGGPSRTYAALRRLIRFFGHNVRGPLDVAQGVYLRHIMEAVYSGSRGDRDALLEKCTYINEALSFVGSAVRVYSDFASDRYAWVDPGEETAVSQAVNLVKRLLHSVVPRASIQTTVEPSDLTCRLDQDRLTFITFGLVENALKAIREAKTVPGVVSVEVRIVHDALRIHVVDDGCGIAESLRDNIWEEGRSFFSTNSTGLGLAIIKAFVEATGGGCITHAHPPNGRGSSFTVVLPLRPLEST